MKLWYSDYEQTKGLYHTAEELQSKASWHNRMILARALAGVVSEQQRHMHAKLHPDCLQVATTIALGTSRCVSKANELCVSKRTFPMVSLCLGSTSSIAHVHSAATALASAQITNMEGWIHRLLWQFLWGEFMTCCFVMCCSVSQSSGP